MVSTTVKKSRNAFQLVSPAHSLVPVTTAAMGTERYAGMSAFTSSMVTLRSMTAMENVCSRMRNVISNVHQAPLNVA